MDILDIPTICLKLLFYFPKMVDLPPSQRYLYPILDTHTGLIIWKKDKLINSNHNRHRRSKDLTNNSNHNRHRRSKDLTNNSNHNTSRSVEVETDRP